MRRRSHEDPPYDKMHACAFYSKIHDTDTFQHSDLTIKGRETAKFSHSYIISTRAQSRSKLSSKPTNRIQISKNNHQFSESFVCQTIMSESKCECLYQLLSLTYTDRVQGKDFFRAKLFQNWKKTLYLIHPDKNNSDSESDFASRFINLARDILSNEIREMVYFESGQRELAVKHDCLDAARAVRYIRQKFNTNQDRTENTVANNRGSEVRVDSYGTDFASPQSSTSSSIEIGTGPIALSYQDPNTFRSRFDPAHADSSTYDVPQDFRMYNEDKPAAPQPSVVEHWPTRKNFESVPHFNRCPRVAMRILSHKNMGGRYGLKFLVQWSGDDGGILSAEDTVFVINNQQLLFNYYDYLRRHHPRMLPYLLQNAPEIKRMLDSYY